MVKKVRVTRTATTVTELEVNENNVEAVYGLKTIEDLVHYEKSLDGSDFWEAMTASVEVNGLSSEKCEVEIVDG